MKHTNGTELELQFDHTDKIERFRNWKQVVFEKDLGEPVDGHNIDGLHKVFGSNLLWIQLNQQWAEGEKANLFGRITTLEQAMHDKGQSLSPLLNSDERDIFNKVREKIETPLEKLEKINTNLTETAEQAENLKKAYDDNVKVEEDSVNDKLKTLDPLIKEVQDLDTEIEDKKKERDAKEAEYANTDAIDDEIDDLVDRRNEKYKEFRRKQQGINLQDYLDKRCKLITSTDKWILAVKRQKLSQTVIDYVRNNFAAIVVNLSDPHITLTPKEGKVCETLTVKGENFKAGETVQVDFGFCEAIVSDDANSEGSFETSFAIPEVRAGEIAVKAKGLTSERSAEKTFKVIDEDSIEKC